MLNTLEAQVPSEKKAADLFQQYYLVRMSATDARLQFGIDLPPEGSPFVLWQIGGQDCSGCSQVLLLARKPKNLGTGIS